MPSYLSLAVSRPLQYVMTQNCRSAWLPCVAASILRLCVPRIIANHKMCGFHTCRCLTRTALVSLCSLHAQVESLTSMQMKLQ